MKILYCIAGMGCYGVLESDIINRGGSDGNELIICAKRVFSLEASQAQVVMSKGQSINFAISIYSNVTMNCSFVADMSEKALFYQKIVEIVTKEEASREN